MSVFSWLSAKMYDKIMRDAESKCLQDWRAALLSNASGAVLEVGPGTGSNLNYYPQSIAKLVLLEPSVDMCYRLRLKLSAHSPYPIELLEGNAEAIPFPDASFNTIVCTLVLCSVSNITKALAEFHRVLVPTGKLIFIEHVAATQHPARLKWQHRLEPIWKIIALGCHLTRSTEEALIQSGFVIEEIARQSIRGVPAIVRPSIRGVAVKQENVN